MEERKLSRGISGLKTLDFGVLILFLLYSPLGLKFTLADLRKSIPEEAFKKDVSKSLFYMGFDYAMIGGALLAFSTLVNSAIWPALPFIAKAAASLAYWNVAGFFMWCIFIVGHDCGHTTFSNNKMLNNIIGHITHGSILVPFFPWQVSISSYSFCVVKWAFLYVRLVVSSSPSHVPQPH